MKAGGGSVQLSISFTDIPLDSTFAVNVQGTDPSNSVLLPPSKVQDYQGGFTPRQGTLHFPPNFATTVDVSHWPGSQPLPDTAQISVTASVQTGPALMRDIAARCRAMGMRAPFRIMAGIPVVILGSTTFRLKFGAKGANGVIRP